MAFSAKPYACDTRASSNIAASAHGSSSVSPALTRDHASTATRGGIRRGPSSAWNSSTRHCVGGRSSSPEPRRAALADGAPQRRVRQLRALFASHWRRPRLARRRRPRLRLLAEAAVLLAPPAAGHLARPQSRPGALVAVVRRAARRSLGRRRRRLRLVQRRRRREGSLLALLPLAPGHLLPRAQAQGDVDDEAQLLGHGRTYLHWQSRSLATDAAACLVHGAWPRFYASWGSLTTPAPVGQQRIRVGLFFRLA